MAAAGTTRESKLTCPVCGKKMTVTNERELTCHEPGCVFTADWGVLDLISYRRAKSA